MFESNLNFIGKKESQFIESHTVLRLILYTLFIITSFYVYYYIFNRNYAESNTLVALMFFFLRFVIFFILPIETSRGIRAKIISLPDIDILLNPSRHKIYLIKGFFLKKSEKLIIILILITYFIYVYLLSIFNYSDFNLFLVDVFLIYLCMPQSIRKYFPLLYEFWFIKED